MEEGKTNRLVLAHAKDIQEAREKHPEVSQEIELFKTDIKGIIKELSSEIKNIDAENDRELVSVLIVNGIHRMTDEVFL